MKQKEKLLPQLLRAAQIYNEHLLGNQFLIISQGQQKGQRKNAIEVGFEKRHFMHLTGSEGCGEINSERFFELCLSNNISLNDFEMIPEANKKLNVIPQIFNFVRNANMIGDFNGTGNFLATEKVAGKISGCMGFVTEENLPYMVPNTVLEEDIRRITINIERILAIYCKTIDAPQYPAIPIHISRDLKSKVHSLKWPVDIQARIGENAEDTSNQTEDFSD